VYNVGTGKSVNLLELLQTLNKLLGTEVSADHGPSRAGDVRHSRADVSRAQRELGYEPNVEFAQGLAKTLVWMRQST
jgi:nucleoside-diphosphate-sugar epimerase